MTFSQIEIGISHFYHYGLYCSIEYFISLTCKMYNYIYIKVSLQYSDITTH